MISRKAGSMQHDDPRASQVFNMAKKFRPAEPEEPLGEVDRLVLGKSVRITIPLANSSLLREIAELMRGTAIAMEANARSGDSEKQRLLRCRDELLALRIKIARASAEHGIKLGKKEGGVVD